MKLALERSHRRRLPGRSVVGGGVLTIVIAGCAWETAAGNLVVLAAGLALLIVVMQFRRGLAGLETVMVAMPFTGVLSIAAYPRSFIGLAARDVLLVLPLFLYVALWRVKGRSPLPANFPWGLLFAFAAVVLVQTFNPRGGPVLLRLIGLKTWLFYTPMILCAYDYCTSRERLHRLLRLTCIAGIPSIVLGLFEAFEIRAGRARQVYSHYGKAASAVSQGFAQLQVTGGGVIQRVPSTFTFGAQYYLFSLAMLASSVAWLRLSTGRRERLFAGAIIGLVCLAAMTSGVREALIGVPAYFFVDFLLARRRNISVLVKLLGSGVTGVLALAAVAGSTALALLSHLGRTAILEYNIVLVKGFIRAFRLTLFGLGTGVDTNAARYALPTQAPAESLFAQGFESWYVKTQLELGLIGLVLICCFIAALVGRLRRILRLIPDARLASAGAALVALAICLLFQNLKAQYLDLDPMAFFFWVALGIVLRLPTLTKDDGS